MGGSSGQVLSGPDAKGKLAIKVCLHVWQLYCPLHSALTPTDIAPLNTKQCLGNHTVGVLAIVGKMP